MRVIVIGAHGQLGADLMRRLGDDAEGLTHAEIEITRPESIAEALDARSPQIVINTAAYNFVDKAEQDVEAAFRVNAYAPLHLARYCVDRGVTLVHVSTDYVFGQDGRRSTPYREVDAPGPLSVYGTSKLAGEHLVTAACPQSFVIRTCGLYGHPISAGKGNFVRTMLRLAQERDELTVVDDQHCTPTSTADLAEAIAAVIQTEEYGLYHVTNGGQTTWCEFAREIFRITSQSTRVHAVSSAEFGAPARRPGYSVLDCERIAGITGQMLPHWRDALDRYLSQP